MKETAILICDDNETVHQTLNLYLRKAGFQALSAYDGATALEMIKQFPIDLIVLDIMMPKLFGTEVCRKIRKTNDLPIIILSSKVDEEDRIAGLELGADDYITKPFSPKEVVTRIKTVLRRASSRKESAPLQLGRIRVNSKAYEVFIGDQQIKMTPKEVELITLLISRPGEAISREDILNTIWGYDYYGGVRTVDTLLARIRGKIPEKRAHIAFRSIYGVGYMIEEQNE